MVGARDRRDRILMCCLVVSSAMLSANLAATQLYNKDLETTTDRRKSTDNFRPRTVPPGLGGASACRERSKLDAQPGSWSACVRYDLHGARQRPSITAIRKEVGPSSDGRRYVAVTRPATSLCMAAGIAAARRARLAPSLRLDKVVHKRSDVRMAERKIIEPIRSCVVNQPFQCRHLVLYTFREQRSIATGCCCYNPLLILMMELVHPLNFQWQYLWYFGNKYRFHAFSYIVER